MADTKIIHLSEPIVLQGEQTAAEVLGVCPTCLLPENPGDCGDPWHEENADEPDEP